MVEMIVIKQFDLRGITYKRGNTIKVDSYFAKMLENSREAKRKISDMSEKRC